jgi:hypothetical protein
VSEDIEIVDLETAPSPIIAAMIVQALKSAGIPAFVNGGLLQDEFAITQKLLGLNEVTIQVRKDQLEEAKKIREMMREAGEDL